MRKPEQSVQLYNMSEVIHECVQTNIKESESTFIWIIDFRTHKEGEGGTVIVACVPFSVT